MAKEEMVLKRGKKQKLVMTTCVSDDAWGGEGGWLKPGAVL